MLVSGFILTGTVPKTLLLQAIGPSLSKAPPVDGAIDDPMIELHKPDGSLVSNDNWRETQESQIEAGWIAPTNDSEAAVIPPRPENSALPGSGAYNGVSLVEIYDLMP